MEGKVGDEIGGVRGKSGDGGKWVKKGRRKWERGKRCENYKMSREREEVQRVSFEEE